MKRRCINCAHCYNPIPGSSRIDVQCCGFGLKEGAAPVGEFCPIDGKKLQNLRKNMVKVRIVQAGICSCEVEVKRAWYLPWATVYDGCLPWRGSYAQAKKIKTKILEEL